MLQSEWRGSSSASCSRWPPASNRNWVATNCPGIASGPIKVPPWREGATIHFADEAGVRSDFHSGTTWGLRGRTPVVSSTGARFGVNLISAVSTQGQLRFMLTKGRVSAAVFMDFLKRLLVNGRTLSRRRGHPLAGAGIPPT